MLGKKSDVGMKLLEKYPKLIIWKCLNHRLELSIRGAIAEVNGINHFKHFWINFILFIINQLKTKKK